MQKIATESANLLQKVQKITRKSANMLEKVQNLLENVEIY